MAIMLAWVLARIHCSSDDIVCIIYIETAPSFSHRAYHPCFIMFFTSLEIKLVITTIYLLCCLSPCNAVMGVGAIDSVAFMSSKCHGKMSVCSLHGDVLPLMVSNLH